MHKIKIIYIILPFYKPLGYRAFDVARYLCNARALGALCLSLVRSKIAPTAL